VGILTELARTKEEVKVVDSEKLLAVKDYHNYVKKRSTYIIELGYGNVSTLTLFDVNPGTPMDVPVKLEVKLMQRENWEINYSNKPRNFPNGKFYGEKSNCAHEPRLILSRMNPSYFVNYFL
jgi:hypothetical protein